MPESDDRAIHAGPPQMARPPRETTLDRHPPPKSRDFAWLAFASAALLAASLAAVRPRWQAAVEGHAALQREASVREARLGRRLPDEAGVVARLEQFRADGKAYWLATAATSSAGLALVVAFAALDYRARRNPFYAIPPAWLHAVAAASMVGPAWMLVADVLPWLWHP